MKNLLVVIDMQKDFIDGALGSDAAKAIVPEVCDIIKNWDGHVYDTKDTHYQSRYKESIEGLNVPQHCVYNTDGWDNNEEVQDELNHKPCIYYLDKEAFGSMFLPDYIRRCEENKCIDSITIIGLCTDICVISNALILRSAFPTTKIKVIAKATAGTTEENKQAAFNVMRSCAIEIEE